MKSSATIARKSSRRHRADREAVTALRLPKTTWKQIDLWRRAHGAKTRSEAVRLLLQQALATAPGRRISRKFAVRASDLAGQAIDRLADRSATREEQAKRKQRLIKGPRELQSARPKV
jgi:hypothetical protein